jgi:hypothetical protein
VSEAPKTIVFSGFVFRETLCPEVKLLRGIAFVGCGHAFDRTKKNPLCCLWQHPQFLAKLGERKDKGTWTND